MFDFVPPEILDALVVAWRYVYIFMPVWLPAIFLTMLFDAWLGYRRSVFWQKQGSVLLEIKLPREIMKSPLAMEMVLNVFYNTLGETTWIHRYWKGQTRPWFSLEMASIGGKVGFYIWTWKGFRGGIETQIYSQYPEVEIYEVEDYTLPFAYDPNKNDLWGCEWKLGKPDPYPIKTYVDYGLDKDPKEEFKIDPMTSVIEFLGSLTSGHNAWIQIIIRAHKKEQRKILPWRGKGSKIEKLAWSEEIDSWKDEAKQEVDKIIEKLKVSKEEGGYPRIPTKGEAEVIASLERSISKTPFDVGIRSLYIADKDKYNPANIGGITGSLRQYNSQNLNEFKPAGWSIGFDYPWQDIFETERKKRKKQIIEYYKKRAFFYVGRQFTKPFVLNTEELATIFHFPGQAVTTPTFERVPSKKSEAPSNLPI